MRSKFLIPILVLLLLLSLPIEAFAEEARANSVFDGILFRNTEGKGEDGVEAWIDGALSQSAGVSSEWYLLALAQSGEYDFSSYESALLEYLSSHTVYSATTRQKYALCLIAVGSTEPYIRQTLSDSIGKMGVMSEIFGLHLLNNGYECAEYTSESLTALLLEKQFFDGGWALSGEVGDVDVTAMAVAALSYQYETNTDVKEAIDRALVFLSVRQTADGGYINYGAENPESVSQVIIALSALGIDCEQDARFIKNGTTLFENLVKFRLSDGGFCHSAGGHFNENATAQAFCAAVSYQRMKTGEGAFYLMDRRDPAGLRDLPNDSPPIGTTSTAPNPVEQALDYKLWVIGGVVGLGAIVGLILYLKRKRQVQNFVALILAEILLITFVCVTDFQSTDDFYAEMPEKEGVIGTVTISIRCDEALGGLDADYLPPDGVILAPKTVAIAQGDTVYTILLETARAERLHVESNGMDAAAYIVGIQYLYEHALGGLSGWVYTVNGESPSVGCGQYVLCPGDVIEWRYSLTLGKDLE